MIEGFLDGRYQADLGRRVQSPPFFGKNPLNGHGFDGLGVELIVYKV